MNKRDLTIKFLIITTVLFLLLSLESHPQQQNNPDAIIGQWLNADSDAKMEIFKQNNKYYGKIVWLKNPFNEKGKPQTDENNPDHKFHNRPIMGLLILRDLVYHGGNVWINGKIYDPDSGNDYSCKMTLKNDNTLKLRGYIGVSLFGRTEVWTRK
jgi:uncharacterized protein (DUF2147 family)